MRTLKSLYSWYLKKKKKKKKKKVFKGIIRITSVEK